MCKQLLVMVSFLATSVDLSQGTWPRSVGVCHKLVASPRQPQLLGQTFSGLTRCALWTWSGDPCSAVDTVSELWMWGTRPPCLQLGWVRDHADPLKLGWHGELF